MRGFGWAGIIVLLSSALFGQNSEAPLQFEVADVHVSTKTPTQFVRTDRFVMAVMKSGLASMLDLISPAWAFDADKILGGPPWVELDRFDVIARVPVSAQVGTGYISSCSASWKRSFRDHPAIRRKACQPPLIPSTDTPFSSQ